MNTLSPIAPRGRRITRLVALLLAAAALSAVSPARARAVDDAAAFDAALQHYEANHWAQAYAALARLADRGHPESARIALQMWIHGPRLYGVEFSASARQVERWAERWGCGGDATDGPCQSIARSGRAAN